MKFDRHAVRSLRLAVEPGDQPFLRDVRLPVSHLQPAVTAAWRGLRTRLLLISLYRPPPRSRDTATLRLAGGGIAFAAATGLLMRRAIGSSSPCRSVWTPRPDADPAAAPA